MSEKIHVKRFICELPEKSIKNSDVKYKTVGRFTSWDINCACCGNDVSNSTEIDIYTEKYNDEFRINACHDCSNTHVYPTLESMIAINGDVTPKVIGDFILSSYVK